MSPMAPNCRAMARSWFRRRGFSRIPKRCLQRAGKVGVIWPNNRDLDDLVPYLDRLAAVALVFPTFRDGRAYSQARLLRERYGYDGELRATGQVLRDQFVFMLRAGFDAFEVKKQTRRGSVRRDREALFGVLPADRRWPRHRAASAHAIASFGECRPVNALAHQALPAKRGGPVRRRRRSIARCATRIAGGGDRGGAEDRRPRAVWRWSRRSARNRRRCSR